LGHRLQNPSILKKETIGAGIYKDNNEAFATLEKLDVIEPNVAKRQEYADAYAKWKYRLEKSMSK
jgi:xylulokinase